jgi:hypothetical protein
MGRRKQIISSFVLTTGCSTESSKEVEQGQEDQEGRQESREKRRAKG